MFFTKKSNLKIVIKLMAYSAQTSEAVKENSVCSMIDKRPDFSNSAGIVI